MSILEAGINPGNLMRPYVLIILLGMFLSVLCQAQGPSAVDDCLPTFQKTYTAPGNHNAFYIHPTPDGGSVVAGNVNPVTGDANQQSPSFDALVMKLSPGGILQWARRMGNPDYDEFRKIKPTSDGGYIAIGQSYTSSYASAIYLVKLTANGDISWSQSYKSRNFFRDIGRDVIETNDGGFAFAGTVEASLPFSQGLLVKTDANGNMLWSKCYYRDEGTDIHSIVEDNDTLALGADYWASLEQKYYGSIIKINKYTGDMISSIGFLADDRSNYGTQLYKTATGFLAGLQLIDGSNFNTKQQAILQFDQNLSVTSQQKLARQDLNPWSSIGPTNDGGFITSAGRLAFGNSYFLYKVNNTGNFDWQKVYGNFPGIIMQIPANAYQYADGSFISACTFHDPVSGTDGKIHVIKVAPNGTTPGCQVGDENNTLLPVITRTFPLTWTTLPPFDYTVPFGTTTSLALALTETQQCQPPPCVLTGIAGADRLCIRNDTITYELQRTGACLQPATWDIDPAYAHIAASTDTSIRLIFKKAGTVTLFGHAATPCTLLTTSLTITVQDNPATLSLGPDIPLCGSSHLLRANAGFASYEWQDGATGADYRVQHPGTYHVLAYDLCGHPYRDTIAVTQAMPVTMNLGNDTSLCPGETLALSPGNAFAAYHWQNGATTSTIHTTQPGTYWVQVTDEKGCTGADSIDIHLKDCSRYLYLPTAFSPNNDRQNDLFKPIVRRRPAQYKLTIFNRWGAKIFETTDPYKGWDGTFKGQPQPAGSYVWTCYYRLHIAGQPEQKEKGVMTLIR